MEKDTAQLHDKMLGRNRFLLLLLAGGVTLAIVSLSLQFCECTNVSSISCVAIEEKTVSIYNQNSRLL